MNEATADIYMSHVTQIMAQCHTYEWEATTHIWMSMSHIWMRRRHTYEWVMSHVWMRRRHTYEWVCHTHESVMTRLTGMVWLRLVASLKLYVSFAEYSLFYRALLQKRPIILRSLLILATPSGVPSVSRIDKLIGLFCKRALSNRRYSAKETCDFIDPTPYR